VQLDPKTEALWRAYLSSLPHPESAIHRFYEVFRIGNSPEGADEGAALIRQGLKTATSSLLWAYEATNKPLPQVGSLSIAKEFSQARRGEKGEPMPSN
jgi:uncharacterized protein YhfF